MNNSYIRGVAAIVLTVVAVSISGCDKKQIDDNYTESSSTVDSSTVVIESSCYNSSETEHDSQPEITQSRSSNQAENISDISSSEIKKTESSQADNSSEAEVESKIEETIVTETPIIYNYYEPIYTEPTVEPLVEEISTEEVSAEEPDTEYDTGYEPSDLYYGGRLYWGDYSYTWYSERVLPGYGLAIDGRHTDDDGFVRDGEGYICVAASSLDKGSVIETPYGEGKVYDTGCAWDTIDVYVNW